MAKNRDYNYKDIDMLVGAQTITENLKVNLPELSQVRTTWNSEYVSQLETKINQGMETHLGLDKKKELRNASAQLADIQAPALRDLSFLKTQVEVDFAGEAGAVNKALGFEQYLPGAQKGNQESLIQLLFAFNKGMTEDLKQQITAKGTNPALLERILGYASAMNQANITQETLKETSKEATEEAIDTFNEIYNQVIGICKIASNYYQYEPLKKEQFTFSKVIANLGVARKYSEETADL